MIEKLLCLGKGEAREGKHAWVWEMGEGEAAGKAMARDQHWRGLVSVPTHGKGVRRDWG